MTVNRTTLLDLPLPVTGTESGTWGDTTNNGLTQYLDIAIAGMSNLTSANFTAGALTIETTEGDSSATNISATSAQYAGFRVTSLAANSTITVGNTGTSPARSYRLINADATYSLTFKATGQTGVTLLPGQSALVAFNGTDYVIVGVVGAGTATDNAVARFDGTTGKLVQNSVVTIADSTGDISGVGQLNATTVDATNIEVTNIKAKDGTAAASIADSTGVVSITANPILSGGTANGVGYLNGSKVLTTGTALTFDGTNLVNLGGVVRALAAATQDALQLQGRAAGTSSYITTLTPGTLTASNTLTLPVGTTTLAGLGTTQTFSAAQTFSSTVTMSGTTTNIALGTSQTSGTWTAGGAAQTGTITLDQSTKAHTLNIGTGATENATTKTINIGTAGVSGSTTNLTYGSGVTGSTTTHIWNSGGSEGMRLTSTGLGIGTSSPGSLWSGANRLVVGSGSAAAGLTIYTSTSTAGTLAFGDGTTGSDPYVGYVQYSHTDNAMLFGTSGTTKATLDSSGNLGLGVTPSAWLSSFKAMQIGATAAISENSFGDLYLSSNAFLDSSVTWKYLTSNFANYYAQENGAHIWYNAPSGTAGNTISFTQAMTLDASGNLLVGGTADEGSLVVIGNRSRTDSSIRIQTSTSSVGFSGLVCDGAGGNALIVGTGGTSGFGGIDSGFIYTTQSRPLLIGTNNTERARITSGGDLLVGTTTNATGNPRLYVSGAFSLSGGSSIYWDGTLRQPTFTVDYDGSLDRLTIGSSANTGNTVGSYIRFLTGPSNAYSERARITSGGYFKASDNGTYNGASGTYHEFNQSANSGGLLVNATNASYTDDALIVYAARNTTNNTFYALSYYNTGAAAYKFRVADSGDVTNTNNSYGAISDVKTKQDIVDAASQWDDLKGLKVRKFRYKNDPTAPLQIGLVAQEAETVSPGLIDEHPDYEEVEVTDEEGNVKTERQLTGTSTKSIKYSVLYMKAIKALQEAMTRIETLEAKVSALEGN